MKSAEDSFIELYKEYGSMIRFVVLDRIGNGTADFEDVIGNVYLSLWQTLIGGKYRGDCNIGTLVYLATNRRIIEYIRYKTAKKRDVNLLYLMPIKDNPLSPEQEYERRLL